jgi:hypothetical protein
VAAAQARMDGRQPDLLDHAIDAWRNTGVRWDKLADKVGASVKTRLLSLISPRASDAPSDSLGANPQTPRPDPTPRARDAAGFAGCVPGAALS